MAKKAKKKVAAKAATSSRKTKKVIAVKSVKARKPAAKKAPRKATRRSTADVAKLRKAVIAGLKSGKSVEVVAGQLGISRASLPSQEQRLIQFRPQSLELRPLPRAPETGRVAVCGVAPTPAATASRTPPETCPAATELPPHHKNLLTIIESRPNEQRCQPVGGAARSLPLRPRVQQTKERCSCADGVDVLNWPIV